MDISDIQRNLSAVLPLDLYNLFMLHASYYYDTTENKMTKLSRVNQFPAQLSILRLERSEAELYRLLALSKSIGLIQVIPTRSVGKFVTYRT